MASSGNQLVLAGAGTGKTTVLTERFAQLVNHYGASPYAILAVTFTNRAAGEMRERIQKMLGRALNGLWIGTFHSIALRMLRQHAGGAGLSANFQILDREDQKSLIKRLMKRLNIDDSNLPPKQVAGFISQCKESCLRAADITANAEVYRGPAPSAQLITLYQAYEELCEQEALVDFSEMLLRCFELLQRDLEVRAGYQRQLGNLLVDEFQDTNEIQYKWLKLLAGDNMNVMAVGDDDQSIYSWRGAQVANMQAFRTQFKDVRLVRLEQNYRSTATILNAANAVIANNSQRIGKTLRTDKGRGVPILQHQSETDQAEASFTIEQQQHWKLDDGHLNSDYAVLYRTHAQSRLFEQACLERGVPYKVYGGLPFFSRAEVKNALAYLRLLVLPDSNEAFSRVVNLPARGIGTRTQQQLRAYADDRGISLWAASTVSALTEQSLPPRAVTSLGRFHELIEGLRNMAQHQTLPNAASMVIKETGLYDHYAKEPGEIGRARLENLDELVNACAGHKPEESNSPLETLGVFLNEVTLQTSAETKLTSEAGDDALQLMTLHSVKGLEFPVVFLTGLEEGLLPHFAAINDSGDVEEERRLLYVGITRAKTRLCISYARMRQLHGKTIFPEPSQFLREFPVELLESNNGAMSVSDNGAMSTSDDEIPLLHQEVYHNLFGTGRVLAIEGNGERTRAQVEFTTGRKWLVLAYANLHLIGQ